MAQVSTTEIEQDEPDEFVSPPRKKAKHPVRNEDEDEGGDDDGDASLGLSPEEVNRMIMGCLSVPPEVAGAAFGLGRGASYAACKSGQIPNFKIGGKIVCPTAPLRKMLCLDPAPHDASTAQIAAHPKKQEIVRSSPKPQRRRRR